MVDLVLDTGPLADILAQYFSSEDYASPVFSPDEFISSAIAKQVNRIIRTRTSYVIASALAFVELARKWDDIVKGRFHAYQLAALLDTPPEWFVVQPVDETLIPFFRQVPSQVVMPDGRFKPIEWTDAVHIATALSREHGDLVTSDERIRQALKLV